MSFSAEAVQSKLEAILASSHRQVAARCTLYCAELVEAAREDERQQIRDRQIAQMSPGSAGAWTRGFFGDSFPHQETQNPKLAQQPTLDQCHTDRTTDRDCEWILRTAFEIRNKVVQRRRSSKEALQSLEEVDLVEEATRSRAVSMSKKQVPSILDPALVERINYFRHMVQNAIRLWQDKLLDDTPSLSRSATVFPGNVQGKAAKWSARTDLAPCLDSESLEESGRSPYRHLISSCSTLSAKNLDLPTEPTGDRTAASSVKSTTPKSRRELHEDLGRELEQLAKDLRNAQIIKSY
ncbi:unnamed protein product [Symbiodinium pilosum]|uniref:Uncharacterized protein n=1 Tax=Symbiodinium pilosum TaxID=2952 RepID=A0A812UWR7_SYMPI|nr:unnamed protein product [Symbiodinium pilosum]